MKTVDKLDRNKERVNELINKRGTLCRELAEEIYEEYGERIEESDMVGRVKPMVYEDKAEDPLYKKARLYVTFSQDYFQDKYGYNPTEEKYSDNIYQDISGAKDEMYHKLLNPLVEEIREKYDSDNYWFNFKIQDPKLYVV